MTKTESIYSKLDYLWGWAEKQPNQIKTQNGKAWLTVTHKSLAKQILDLSLSELTQAMSELKNNGVLDYHQSGATFYYSLTDKQPKVTVKGITCEQACKMSKEWDSSIPFGGGYRWVTPTVAPYGPTQSKAPYYYHNGERFWVNSCWDPDTCREWITQDEYTARKKEKDEILNSFDDTEVF